MVDNINSRNLVIQRFFFFHSPLKPPPPLPPLKPPPPLPPLKPPKNRGNNYYSLYYSDKPNTLHCPSKQVLF